MATLLPVIPVEPEALHAQKVVDFSDEAELKKHVRSSRWLAIDVGSFKVCSCLSFATHIVRQPAAPLEPA